MKPLIIFQFDEWQDDKVFQDFENVIADECKEGGYLEGYTALVIKGAVKISVNYPRKPIKYFYNKLKAWLILKIWKRKISSGTSVIM